MPTSQVFAQGISFGESANQKSIEVIINENGDIHVIHEVQKSSGARQLDTIPGTVLNLTVSDVEKNPVEYGVTGPPHGVMIFPAKEDVIVEYDLEDVLVQNGDIWSWEFLYLKSTKFYFPEKVDMVFVSGDPVHLRDSKGITCHGCQMVLEYILDEPIVQQRVSWEEKEFNVIVRTLAEFSSFNFDQPSRSISMDVKDENQYVTLVIPLELLWRPYDVYFNNEKILKHEFVNNGTHVWLNVKPQTNGNLNIIGTSVVPEFPIFIPLVLALTLVIAIQFRGKVILR